ncbi:MAG: hypothetical protein R3F11_09845 [Verrucomicrobiales bacterium]
MIEVPVLSEFQQAAGFVSFDADFSAIDGGVSGGRACIDGQASRGGDGDVSEVIARVHSQAVRRRCRSS